MVRGRLERERAREGRGLGGGKVEPPLYGRVMGVGKELKEWMKV